MLPYNSYKLLVDLQFPGLIGLAELFADLRAELLADLLTVLLAVLPAGLRVSDNHH